MLNAIGISFRWAKMEVHIIDILVARAIDYSRFERVRLDYQWFIGIADQV
jgi:hypothetical protein